jgi:hypothetical protein
MPELADTIDTRITSGLHPENVKAIDGYDDDTALVLEPTERAFAAAYEGVKSVWRAKDAVANDPTLTESARILKVDDMATKVQGKLTREFDSVRVNLEKGIAHIEGELTAPVTAKASHGMADSIRTHVKNLSAGERMPFIHEAINDGDDLTASSILGAPAYLSGIDANMKQTFTRMYHERTSPALAKRLRVMTAAKELVEQRGGLILSQLEKAVGVVEVKSKQGMVVKRIRPQELREQRDKSDKAFALPSAA